MIATGQRFGRMTAVERGADYVHPRGGRERWWFECDCGNRVLWQPSIVRHNAEHGWGCCNVCVWCVRAAGEPPARALRSVA
jgi:hypothetical protein